MNSLHSNNFSMDWINLAIIDGIENIRQVKKRNQIKQTPRYVKNRKQIDKETLDVRIESLMQNNILENQGC